MSRQYLGAHQQAYPGHGDQTRIGLRAVAAAIRYQGDANHAERQPAPEAPAPAAAVAPTEDQKA